MKASLVASNNQSKDKKLLSRQLVILAALVLIAGCDSDFDKCMNAETAKVKNVTANSNPALATLTKLNNFDRGELEAALELGVQVFDKAGGNIGCKYEENKDNCWHKVQTASAEATKQLEDAGYGEMMSLFKKKGRSFRNSNDWSSLKPIIEQNVSGLNNPYTSSHASSEERIAFELAKFDAETKAIFEFYELERLMREAPSVATETCNSRGLYD